MESLMRLSEILFPSSLRCMFCGREVNSSFSICAECNAELPYISGKTCDKCGGRVLNENYCIDCSKVEHRFVRNFAIFDYSSSLRDKVVSFKGGRKYLGYTFAHIMYDYYLRLGIDFDIIIPMPIHKTREKERGFNQAEILVEEIKSHTDKVRTDILYKAVNTAHQTGLSRENRLKNVVGSFAVSDKSIVKDKVILIVDDIYTTGSTMSEVADTLLKSGAKAVYGLTLARGKTIDM